MSVETIEKIDDSVVTIEYAKRILEALGEDVSCIEDWWCYYELIKHYGHKEELLSKIKQYFEQYPNSEIAYVLCEQRAVNRAWAEKIVEIENDPRHAFLLVRDCDSEREWAEKIIESNNDSYYAHLMFKYCESDRLWLEKIRNHNRNGS